MTEQSRDNPQQNHQPITVRSNDRRTTIDASGNAHTAVPVRTESGLVSEEVMGWKVW